MSTEYSENSPVVKTTHGLVRGTLHKAIYDELYFGFDGIPYARPPVGELRFRDPQDADCWDGIRDCSSPVDKCLQVGSISKKVEGSEDCLYLNISAKKLQSDKPLPVLVYVHGGIFIRGDASRRAWSPDYLMREDVIHISMGYRMGPIGFLSFSDPALGIPGNAGIKDVVLALKWIKANVGNFNGDPNNITLFGHSSGSMMVQLLMVSPQTEGLFHKAILLAGYMLETNRQPDMEYRLAQHLGYEGANNDADVFDFINKADPELVVSADIWTNDERLLAGSLPAFVPCVEHYITPNAVLLAEPRVLQRTAWSNRIPLMLGATSEEGLYSIRSIENNFEFFMAHPDYFLPRSFMLLCSAKQRRQLGRSLVEHFCQASIDELTEEHYPSLVKIRTFNILHEQQRVIRARLAYSQADTYLFRFDFDSPDFNFYRIRILGPDTRGVGHVSELPYIFKLPNSFKLEKSRAEYKLICQMVTLFAQFALRSNPNAPLTQSLVDWKPISRHGPKMCLNISEKLQLIPQPDPDKFEFYDEMFKKANMELI